MTEKIALLAVVFVFALFSIVVLGYTPGSLGECRQASRQYAGDNRGRLLCLAGFLATSTRSIPAAPYWVPAWLLTW